MQQAILDFRLDVLVYALIGIACVVSARRRFGEVDERRLTKVLAWLFCGALLASGAVLAEWAGVAERDRLREMVAGLAPTYALELTLAGHWQIAPDTPADDPRYLELIARQRKWLRVNPAVSDIYTFRRMADGQIVLLVDSETDYNRNGRYDGEEEQRTSIGEPYDATTDQLRRAFEGRSLFEESPVTDRWGTWVSAYCPMYAPDGSLDGVLGVDYAADQWSAQILTKRMLLLGAVMIVLLVFSTASGAVAAQRRELSERTQTQMILQAKNDELANYATALEANNEALRSVRRELEQAILAKSQFLANMSHEIRTPLNGVVGMLELLSGTQLDKTQQRFARTARISADCLLSLINDVLDFSKIEAGKLELDAVDFDLRTLIEDLGEMFATRAEQKGIELCIDLPPEMPVVVRGDGDRLRQILLNLITNAIKFTDQGQVVVRVKEVEPLRPKEIALAFEVSDTGIGIPQERQDRLFKSFSQVDSSTTRKYGGTGLGLALSKQLVELFGGCIGVTSEENVGSSFHFTVRLEMPHGIVSEWTVPKLLAGRRVLIVDDNETNRCILHTHLTAWGIDCDLASDGAAALETLQASAAQGHRHDLLIVDDQMPIMDGRQLLTLLAEHVEMRELKIVMLTSLSAPLSEDERRHLRVAKCLVKPARQSRLLEMLAEVLLGHVKPTTESTSASGATASGSRTGARILLADDNEVNQFVTTEMLRRAGWETVVVGNGKAACDAVAQERFDLVLMDCQMPVMDGFAATAQIRALEAASVERKRVPIVALTANAVKGDREACLAAGMDDYLAKPIEAARLIDTVERWVDWSDLAQPRQEPNTRQPVATWEADDAQGVAPPSELEAHIDVAILLSRCLSDPNIAAHILAMFPQSATTQLEVLHAALDSGAESDGLRAVHTLKGLAGSLGADDLQRLALHIEQQARQRPLVTLLDEIRALEDELARCTASVPHIIARLQNPAAD